jgi:hypothetical protein
MRNQMFLPLCVAAALLAGCSHAGTAGVMQGPVQSSAGVTHLTGSPPPQIPQLHVSTWDAIGIPGGSYKVTMAQAAPWLNYVMTSPALSASAKAVGMTTLLYSDPNRQYPGDVMWTNDETTFAHDCSGNRISISGSNTWLMDPHSQHLWQLWPSFVQLTHSWGGVFDYVFEDSADEINVNRFSSMPCNFDQTDWTNVTNQMDTALGYKIVFNGLGLVTPNSTAPGPAFALNSTAQGGMSEDCYVGRTPTGYYYYPHWGATENTEILTAQAQKLFVCHADAWVDATANDALRTYFYASFLLTYDRDAMAVDTEFLTASDLHVMPEDELVPTHPLVKTPSDISMLMLPSGVYGREYRDCYVAGQWIGRCAAAVNPNNPSKGGPLAYPWGSKYQHTLVMNGAGAYDGGTIATNGPPPPATLPGGSAVIVFQ